MIFSLNPPGKLRWWPPHRNHGFPKGEFSHWAPNSQEEVHQREPDTLGPSLGTESMDWSLGSLWLWPKLNFSNGISQLKKRVSFMSGMPLKGAKGAQGFLLQNHQSVDDVMSNLAKTLVLSCFHGACVMSGSKPGWYLIKPKCFAWHNYILDHVSCFFFKQILPSCNKFFHHRCHLHHGSF